MERTVAGSGLRSKRLCCTVKVRHRLGNLATALSVSYPGLVQSFIALLCRFQPRQRCEELPRSIKITSMSNVRATNLSGREAP